MGMPQSFELVPRFVRLLSLGYVILSKRMLPLASYTELALTSTPGAELCKTRTPFGRKWQQRRRGRIWAQWGLKER